MKPEDGIHKNIATYLTLKLRGEGYFWTYMPFGEYRTPITGALLKAKGTKRGVPDFMILQRRNGYTNIIWLEVKARQTKGKQSKEQIEFEQQTKKSKNESYYIVHDLDEVKEALNNERKA